MDDVRGGNLPIAYATVMRMRDDAASGTRKSLPGKS